VSAIVCYKVVEVKPAIPGGNEDDPLVKRMLGRVMTAQDVVNLGGFFEGKDQVSFYHQNRKWLLTVANDDPADEWNALPHGRDEGAYDTDIQVDRRVQRLFIP
jgi:hypothetical protein